MGRKILLLFILIFMLGTGSVFASDWDFTYEKEVYYKSADLMKNFSGDYNGKINENHLTSTFIENFFNAVETHRENEGKYSQEDYPYSFIYFNSPTSVYLVSKNKNQSNFIDSIISTGISYSIYTVVKYDSNYNISSVTTYNNNTSNNYYSIYFNNYHQNTDKPNGIYLSDYMQTAVNWFDFPILSSTALYEYYPSFSGISGINKYNPSNNFILNKEFKIGYDYDYVYNYYYYNGNEKISINDYITFNITTFWYGTQYSPYILNQNIENLPNNTDFYFDLEIIAKGASSFSKKIVDGEKVFYTFYDENKGEVESGDIGGGTTPSGDNGGTTTPDYSEKLDNIQGSIDNVNQNLDNISGELNEINNNLTTVPELSGEVISSGDIINALGFEFAQDPYSNFWLELTTGLGNAFTDEFRSINVQFRENTYEINLDNFSTQLPGVLKVFLTSISTVFISWKMLKYWKIIVDNITSGNMDEVLSMNEEERYY